MTMLIQTLAAVGTVLATSAFAHATTQTTREIRGALPCAVVGTGTTHKPVLDPTPPRFPRRWPKPPSLWSIGREYEHVT
ncbi:hypothetical protein [Rhizobiales bacterium]|uniref:hypothetical protein n=1 Tax=Ensifer sp. R-19 TaxID=3404055 RepID=UPI000DD87717